MKFQRETILVLAMSAKSVKDGQHFPHKTGDVVLVKWRDGKIYFAKIKTIEWSKKRCVVIFDDKSQDLARFSWIHDGKRCVHVAPLAEGAQLFVPCHLFNLLVMLVNM